MPRYTLKVNGKAHSVSVDADTPLLYVLRDDLSLKAQNSVAVWASAVPAPYM